MSQSGTKNQPLEASIRSVRSISFRLIETSCRDVLANRDEKSLEWLCPSVGRAIHKKITSDQCFTALGLDGPFHEKIVSLLKQFMKTGRYPEIAPCPRFVSWEAIEDKEGDKYEFIEKCRRNRWQFFMRENYLFVNEWHYNSGAPRSTYPKILFLDKPILLRYFLGRTKAEISEELGLPGSIVNRVLPVGTG